MTMIVLNKMDALKDLCLLHHKWGMYIHSYTQDDEPDEIEKAAPYLNCENINHDQVLSDGEGYLLFDTEEEMDECFNTTVCDGPTETNSYNGQTRVYALTCDPDGQFLSENS